MENAKQANPSSNRRPLKVRDAAWAQKFARWMSGRAVTPNQISVASVFFAALAAACLLGLPMASGPLRIALPILAALFIQCRLLCNLFDGMVAMEGGKKTASGELFNDIPDRIADPLILVAAGYAAGAAGWPSALGQGLGWAAGLLAVLTAYIRVLGVSIGAPADFRGPMAKQHRMALMTGACLLTAAEPWLWPQGRILLAALAMIVAGCTATALRRIAAAHRFLESKVK